MKKLYLVSNLSLQNNQDDKNNFFYTSHLLKFINKNNFSSQNDLGTPIFSSRSKLIKASKDVDDKYEKFLPIIADRLNFINNRDYSFDFWKKALSMSLVSFITLLHRHYHYSSKYFSPKKFRFRLLHKKNFSTPRDFEQLKQLLQSTWFGQEQLFSLFVQYKFEQSNDFFNAKYTFDENKINSFVDSDSDIQVGLMGCYFENKYFEYLKTQSKDKIGRINVCKFSFESSINHQKRKLLAEPTHGIDSFDNFFFYALRYLMPKHLVEDFANYEKKTDQRLNKYKKLKFIISEAWLGHSEINLFRALGYETRSIKTFYNEHNCLVHPLVNDSVKQQANLIDKFLTLGWKRNDPRFISCGSLFPFKIKKVSKKNIPILHINYSAEQHAPHYSSVYSTFGYGAVKHLRFLKRYFEYLPMRIKKMVNFRSYPKDYALMSLCYDQKEVLKKQFHDLKIMEPKLSYVGETCKEQIARSKIVVIDGMYTAYLESLSMNVPTVCFYNKKTRFLKDEYNDFYDDLIDAKILHSSPKSAAEHIISVHENPYEWWNDPQTQKLKNRWLRRNLRKHEVLIDFLLKLTDNKH